MSGLTVKVGDTVTANQKLFVSSSSDITKSATTATRNLTKAKTQLTNDKSDLTAAKAQLVTDQNALNVAKAQLATDEIAAKAITINAVSADAASDDKSISDAASKIAVDEKAISDATTKISNDQKSITDATSKISDDNYSITDATAELSDANDAVAAMTITSPIGGLVTAMSIANGNTTQGSESSLTVSDMSSMKVNVAVDELDISSVKIGQEATIKFDALPDKTYTGTVELVSQTGVTNNNITTYDVVVSVSDPTGIRLGMNANVIIAIQSNDNAIVIPSEALIETNDKKFVRVQDTASTNSEQKNSTALAESDSKLVEITTGIETEDYIEVTKGVTSGQALLVQLASSSSSTTTQGGMGGFQRSGSGERPTGGQNPSGGKASSKTTK
nr:efflux RND transporter periplasmic adaptor subunit [Clostridium sp.]